MTRGTREGRSLPTSISVERPRNRRTPPPFLSKVLAATSATSSTPSHAYTSVDVVTAVVVVEFEGAAVESCAAVAVDVAVGVAVVLVSAAAIAAVVADAAVIAVGVGEDDAAAAAATRLARRPLPVPISSHRRTSSVVWSLLLRLRSSPGLVASRRTAFLYAGCLTIDRSKRVCEKTNMNRESKYCWEAWVSRV